MECALKQAFKKILIFSVLLSLFIKYQNSIQQFSAIKKIKKWKGIPASAWMDIIEVPRELANLKNLLNLSNVLRIVST